MISAWDIYWVMQLDSIGDAVSKVAFVAGFTGIMAVLGTAFFTECGTDKDWENAAEQWARGKRLGIFALSIAGIFTVLNAFIPSTKTAAAMVVLSAVANNQAIQKEAGDLYGIAKDALRNLAAPKHEESK